LNYKVELLENVIALKIDVDTYRGMRNGIPTILKILKKYAILATFYLSIGPDASGRALFQLLKNSRFLQKMVKTRAPALYGFKTALYGTLLPSPMIALSFPDIVKQIRDDGHELQFHAWDHRRWQDELPQKSESWIRDWFKRGMDGFETLAGERPTSFGAPAWLIDQRVLAIAKELDFDYLSCTRASEPFIHQGVNLVEIPSDLPCFEEVGMEKGVQVIMSALSPRGAHVLPVHAEVEGGILSAPFESLIQAIKGRGYRFVTLREIFDTLDQKALPVRSFRLELLPGRSTVCAV
jgi:peptidoglycan/xylan/chitin deacetylase (PgdA/CDA1 family)